MFEYFHDTVSQLISTSFKFFYNKLLHLILNQEDPHTVGEAQMQKQDWLLIYLDLPSTNEQSYIDPIRIQKGLFLFGMKNKERIGAFYSFKPYLYGPYSPEIYKDLRELQKQGLVLEQSIVRKGWNCYTLTKAGKLKAKSFINNDTYPLVAKMAAIKLNVTKLSVLGLLKEIYEEYEDYAVKSIVNVEALNDVSSGAEM